MEVIIIQKENFHKSFQGLSQNNWAPKKAVKVRI